MIPWGGMQVVVAGDFYQLQPVKARLTFRPKSWTKAQFTNVVLRTNHRQKENQFSKMVSELRRGYLSGDNYKLLRKRQRHKPAAGAIYLMAKRADAARLNKAQMQKLPGKEHWYTCALLIHENYCMLHHPVLVL